MGTLKLEIDETGVYSIEPDRRNSPLAKLWDELLEGSGWGPVPAGARIKLHPEIMSAKEIEDILQHETNPKIIEYFLPYRDKAPKTRPYALELSAKQLRDFLEAKYKKKGLWSGWQEIIDYYRQCGMDDYVNELIRVLALDEVLEKYSQD